MRFTLISLCLIFCVSSQAQQGSVVLSGRTHPKARPVNDRGAVADSFPLSGVTLLLKPSAAQRSELGRFLEQQRDPASTDYHRWLTPELYADRFGASASDLRKVTAWLESQGFTVDNVARSRTWVTFSGSGGQAGGGFEGPGPPGLGDGRK